jgi:hypothetical protein
MVTLASPSFAQRQKASFNNPLLRSDSAQSDTHVADASSSSSSKGGFLVKQWQKWQRKIPFLKRLQEYFLRIPPRVRFGFVVFWFCWKISVAVAFLVIFFLPREGDTGATGLRVPRDQAPTRVLYIVTTLAEYNTGTRATQKGQDRLAEVLIPVLADGASSIMAMNYDVDLYLICAYELLPHREQLIRNSLPEGVGFEVWDNAAPLGYEKKHSSDKVIDNTRALARQHRYVVKDKLFYYDLFLAFEDDMRITGLHLQHFLYMSEEIDRLRQSAPTALKDVPENLDDYKKTKFYGPMTQEQLSRVVPGFIRVEVLLNATEHGAQRNVLPIPRDFEFDDGTHHVHPEICCLVDGNRKGLPPAPDAEDVIIWETNAKAFSLRELPPGQSELDWTALMMGPGKKLKPAEKIGGYWTGRKGAFGDEKRPSGGVPELIAQQGGWMATQSQIARMNNGLCMGSFLPPFDQPTYYGDGQESMNVEFWSGSYQFFTGVRGGCNMQRVVSLHPDHFSKHLIYHAANNKQRQLGRERMVRADHLFGQLNTVKKIATKAKAEMEAAKK